MDVLLDELPFWQAGLAFLAINVVLHGAAILAGELVYRLRPAAHIQPAPAAVTRAEVALSALTVLLNVAITCAGLALYRAGVIALPRGLSAWVLVDLVVFTLAMDGLMYGLHRVAHLGPIYRLIHRVHHAYDNPTATALYALHPGEVLGFGSLWVVLLCVWDFSLGSVVGYTALNLVFGLVGHLGIEVFPAGWARGPVTGLVSTATFHNQHHASPTHNMGFYTTIWDRWFGTLHPAYEAEFEANARRGWGGRAATPVEA